MEKDKNLVKYLIFGGALGLSYIIIQYLSSRKKSGARALPVERTIKVMQEIKYQVLTTCFNYAEAVNVKLKGGQAEKDLEIVFRTQLAKIYEARQNAVLNKHQLTKDQYGTSLEAYKKDDKIKKGLAEIFDMMERAVQGKIPDLAVLPQAQQHLSKEQLLTTYFEMCELISVRLWQKLEENRKNNPGFNSRDEAHYQKAIKDLSIFDIKTEFLKNKGYRSEWGSANEIFYKVMEFSKQKDLDFKNKAVKIEKAYEKTIEAVTTQTATLTPERIKFMLHQNSGNQVQSQPETKSQHQPQTQSRPFPMAAVSKSLGRQTKPSKNQDDDLENLMMQELLSRSAENPKDSEPIKEEEKKMEEKVVKEEKEEKVVKEEKEEKVVKEEKEEKKEKEQLQKFLSEEKPVVSETLAKQETQDKEIKEPVQAQQVENQQIVGTVEEVIESKGEEEESEKKVVEQGFVIESSKGAEPQPIESQKEAESQPVEIIGEEPQSIEESREGPQSIEESREEKPSEGENKKEEEPPAGEENTLTIAKEEEGEQADTNENKAE